MPREVMTIQLGGYSNYVGSHFWNIQEECMSYNEDEESKENSEVRSDILWRQTRDTVVPRLMTLDLKSERGALRRLGYLYPDKTPAHQPAAAFGGLGGIAEDIAVDAGAWGGAVASFYSEPVAVHPFVQHLLDTDAQAYEDEGEEYYEDGEDALMGEGDDGVGAKEGGDGDGHDLKEDGEGGSEDTTRKESMPDFVINDDSVRYWSDFLKVGCQSYRKCARAQTNADEARLIYTALLDLLCVHMHTHIHAHAFTPTQTNFGTNKHRFRSIRALVMT